MYPSSPLFESSTQAENPQAAKNRDKSRYHLMKFFLYLE
jgi:hypothetical protein